MRRFPLSMIALMCLPLGSCISGLIYRHTTEPLPGFNLDNTAVGTLDGTADVKDLNLGGYVRIAWDGNDIASAARNAGVNEVHHADLERFSILGIWNQDYVHVYGK